MNWAIIGVKDKFISKQRSTQIGWNNCSRVLAVWTNEVRILASIYAERDAAEESCDAEKNKTPHVGGWTWFFKQNWWSSRAAIHALMIYLSVLDFSSGLRILNV